MQLLWSDQEWYFCLHCFYHATDRNKAIIKFKERFPHRTQVAIKRKFARESLQPGSYLGMGIKQKTTKAQLIQELKDAYKTIGQPYTCEQFDKVSAVSSALIIGYFGDWDLALEQADLKKKFDSYNQTTQQINSFNPEKELKEHLRKQYTVKEIADFLKCKNRSKYAEELTTRKFHLDRSRYYDVLHTIESQDM